MNSRMTIFALLLLGLFASTACAQVKSQTICKGSSIPEGFVVSGETISDSCPGGTALIIKRSSRSQSNLDQFTANTSKAPSEAAPYEVIAPGQCDAFQKEIAST